MLLWRQNQKKFLQFNEKNWTYFGDKVRPIFGGNFMQDLKIPAHIAIILDGNRRWAKKRMLPAKYGHKAGGKAVELICEEAYNMGVKYLTVYAFSTENWKRQDEEVKAIMDILRDYLKTCFKLSKKNNMRVRVIGDRSRLDEDIQETIKELEEFSKDATGLSFQVALNYGGRDELVRSFSKITRDIQNGKLKPEEITEELVCQYLDTSEIPDPDLLIRTSGEERLSNFLLWQLAYTEFYFTDVLWPDFGKKDLEKAIAYYNKRDRRFGGV